MAVWYSLSSAVMAGCAGETVLPAGGGGRGGLAGGGGGFGGGGGGGGLGRRGGGSRRRADDGRRAQEGQRQTERPPRTMKVSHVCSAGVKGGLLECVPQGHAIRCS